MYTLVVNSRVYIPVTWPDSQDFIGREHCHLINDDEGYQEFGDSAYFVRLDVYEEVMKEKTEPIPKEKRLSSTVDHNRKDKSG